MTTQTKSYELPIPTHYDPSHVEQVYPVKYEDRAREASLWAKTHDISPATLDSTRICFMPIDTQLTFCNPDFELFVGGRSGRGAIEDNVRLSEFLYRNLRVITKVIPTMDTHTAAQIFHQVFWINEAGEHPAPSTMISLDDVEKGVWKVNPGVTASVFGDPRKYTALQAYALHYVRTLTDNGKYLLMIWPYHAMLGGIGHALVPAVEEALFFHNIARNSQTGFQIKGGKPLTENYSVLRPEVLVDHMNRPVAQKNSELYKTLLSYDMVVIAGQAKSHCVAWTIEDLLNEIAAEDKELAKKVYLVEDLTSAVFVPKAVTGLPDDIDFTEQADAAFEKFAAAGMNVVNGPTPIEDWPGVGNLAS